MSHFVSRVLVGIVGLPVVLGLTWLGGWWLFALAAAAALLALHEFYGMTRPLRPLVLAGYLGVVLVLVGAEIGGVEWMIGGFLATLALAFVLYGISSTRQTATVSISSTVLGAGWVGLGLGCILLLRALDHHGRLAALSVLLAVFAADTAALYVGKLIGRHKLAPALSPGKTWEGFVGGAAAAVAVVFFALYRSGFVDGWRSFVLGGVIALSSVMGDLFESALKRDMEVKDSGRLLLGHGGVLDRLDAILFAGAASFYVIRAFGAT